MAFEEALRRAGIDCDEVLAAARALFAGHKRPSRLVGLDSVAEALGRAYGVELEPTVAVLPLNHQVYRAAYQLPVRSGGELTLVRLELPRKTIIVAHLSDQPRRLAMLDHAAVAGALAVVDFPYFFRGGTRRIPNPDEAPDVPRSREH